MRLRYRRLLFCLRRAPRPLRRAPKRLSPVPPLFVTLAAALLIASGLIRLTESRLRPIIVQSASTQAQNMVIAVLEQAMAEDLARRELGYGDFVSIQRDGTGRIIALTTDMAAMNLLRAELVSRVLEALEGIDVSEIRVPLGVLLDSELVWARGPDIQAHAMSVGTVSAEFESQFTSAGVNQTLHRIWIRFLVPVTILLPGDQVEVPVETSLCVTETVLVGQVPETYLQFGTAN